MLVALLFQLVVDTPNVDEFLVQEICDFGFGKDNCPQVFATPSASFVFEGTVSRHNMDWLLESSSQLVGSFHRLPMDLPSRIKLAGKF